MWGWTTSAWAVSEGDGVETHGNYFRAKVWIIEGLNLSEIEPGKYDLACLPQKLIGSDGAPARAALRPQ